MTKRLLKASARSLMVDGVGGEESSLDVGRSEGEVDSEREREDTVRSRGAGPGLSAPGVRGVVGRVDSAEASDAAVAGGSSSSVHWRWRMTDFVAH